jgi:hypothetical protein
MTITIPVWILITQAFAAPVIVRPAAPVRVYVPSRPYTIPVRPMPRPVYAPVRVVPPRYVYSPAPVIPFWMFAMHRPLVVSNGCKRKDYVRKDCND